MVPGRTRPITSSQSTRVFLIRAVVPNINGSAVSGIQISGMPQLVIFAPTKPAGATPMIVNAWPLIWYVDPTTEGSEPYFSCQAWKLITATGGAPSWSSASIKQPAAPRGYTESLEKVAGDILAIRCVGRSRRAGAPHCQRHVTRLERCQILESRRVCAE